MQALGQVALLRESFFGTVTSTTTYCEPRRPLRSDGTPRPLSRSVWPGWVPAGIFTSRSPSSVGTFSLPPTIAVVAGTRRTEIRSSPRRSKRSSSATSTST